MDRSVIAHDGATRPLEHTQTHNDSKERFETYTQPLRKVPQPDERPRQQRGVHALRVRPAAHAGPGSRRAAAADVDDDDVTADAVTLIGCIMDARSPVASFIIDRDCKDAMFATICRHFMQFKGADETIVVGRLAEMDMDSDLKLQLCFIGQSWLGD